MDLVESSFLVAGLGHRVSTVAMVNNIVYRIEHGQNYLLESARRSGKTTLIQMISAELRTRGIDHQIVVAREEDLPAYSAAGFHDVVKQGTATTAKVVILDRAHAMDPSYVASLGAVSSLIKIGTHIGAHKDSLGSEAVANGSHDATR